MMQCMCEQYETGIVPCGAHASLVRKAVDAERKRCVDLIRGMIRIIQDQLWFLGDADYPRQINNLLSRIEGK